MPLFPCQKYWVIDTLPNNKSLGPDGFTGEYFKHFKLILGCYLSKVYETATLSASYPSEMLEALIVILPKPGKDPDKLQHFCPISLLYNDLKMYAKLIALWLIDILPILMHPD